MSTTKVITVRVGVYIDAYNLYYGARGHCGRGTAGWRWLDVKKLATTLLAERHDWAGSYPSRVMYCTARVDARVNPDAQRDQDIYLKALLGHGSVDYIEYGSYVSRAKKALLATTDDKGRPVVATSQWPVMVKDAQGNDVRQARFMVQVLNMEEKGSDVNVATHLLLDVLRGDVDAALVISNDSDLRLPIQEARKVVPVAVIHPGKGPLAGALAGERNSGAGRHWWRQLTRNDLYACQLPQSVSNYVRPNGW